MLAVTLDEAARKAQARYAAGLWPELIMLGLRDRVQRKKYLGRQRACACDLVARGEVGGNLRGKVEIKALFPDVHPFATPKPEQLLQRIIHVASSPGDIVLTASQDRARQRLPPTRWRGAGVTSL